MCSERRHDAANGDPAVNLVAVRQTFWKLPVVVVHEARGFARGFYLASPEILTGIDPDWWPATKSAPKSCRIRASVFNGLAVKLKRASNLTSERIIRPRRGHHAKKSRKYEGKFRTHETGTAIGAALKNRRFRPASSQRSYKEGLGSH